MAMTKRKANAYLASIGRPELDVWKTEGFWYLLGDSADFTNQLAERCLHITRIDDLTTDMLDAKIAELTKGY